MNIVNFTKGIYYVTGDIFPIQIIITSNLSEESNIWLRCLTNDLNDNDIIEKLTKEYSKHEREVLYKSAMDIIVRANNKQFKEASDMCEALKELVHEIYKYLEKNEEK